MLPSRLLTLSSHAANPDLEDRFENWRLSGHEEGLFPVRKKSLARKLDEIASNSASNSGATSPASPLQQYMAQHGSPMRVSTPKQQQQQAAAAAPAAASTPTFDGRTFTRGQRDRFLRQTGSPMRQALNLTFDKDQSPLNATFTQLPADTNGGGSDLNATFDKLPSADDRLNQTYELPSGEVSGTPGRNSTFTRRKPSLGSNRNNPGLILPANTSDPALLDRRLSRGSSHDPMDEDVLSTTSDSSLSHQLNDVGDVQNIARIQEESLKTTAANEANHNAHHKLGEEGAL